LEPVLVTGSEGFIGRSLCEYFSGRGYSVVRLDLAGGADLVADVVDFSGLSTALEQYKVGSVVHLAAVSNPPSCSGDPLRCLQTNIMGTLNMLEIARRRGVERFVFLSSANVYGPRPPLPVTEEAPLAPRTLYDYSKVLSEMIVRTYHTLYGLPAVVLRSWKVFGEYDSPRSAVSRFIDACLEGREIHLFNGGRDVTDPYHVVNLCRAVELALKSEKAVGEIFNIGGGSRVSIRELAEIIRELTSSQSPLVELPPRSAEEAEPMVSYPSIDKAAQVLGYRPIVGLREGLERVIRYKMLNAGR
jgi:nucleoside-diphosphate-sugar epimerase